MGNIEREKTSTSPWTVIGWIIVIVIVTPVAGCAILTSGCVTAAIIGTAIAEEESRVYEESQEGQEEQKKREKREKAREILRKYFK